MVTSSEHPDRTQRCSSFRKVSKPLMEKKRRARINVSLEQLKTLLEKHYSQNIRKRKLEKADILELTVKYLKTIQSAAQGAPFVKSAEYQSGFRNCLYGVSQFLLRSEDASETLYLRLLQELGNALPATTPCFRTLDRGHAAPRSHQQPGVLALQGPERDPKSRCPQGFSTDRALQGPPTDGALQGPHMDSVPQGLSERVPQRLSPDRTPSGVIVERLPEGLITNRFPEGLITNRLPEGLMTDRLPQGFIVDRVPQVIRTDANPQGCLTDRVPQVIRTDTDPQGCLTDRVPLGHQTQKTLVADPKPVHLQELKTDFSPHPELLHFPANNLPCVPEVGSPRTLHPTECVWRPW